MTSRSNAMRKSSAGAASLAPPVRAASYQPQDAPEPRLLSEKSKSVDPGIASLTPPARVPEEADIAVPAIDEADERVVDIDEGYDDSFQKQEDTHLADDEQVYQRQVSGVELWGLRVGVFAPFALGVAGIVIFTVKLN